MQRVRFFSKDMGQVGWTRWFDIGDDLTSVFVQIKHLEVERVEVSEEMTKQEFETQFLVSLEK